MPDPPSGFAQTTAFRLIASYVAVFVAAAAVIAGTLVWQTNEVLTRQVLSTIAAEADGLRALWQSQGAGAVAEPVAARSRLSQTHLYILVDRDGTKIAGNLSRWPPELGSGSGGLYRYTPAAGSEERIAVGVPLDLDGQRLLISRDVEDQVFFIRRIRTLFLVGFGLLTLVGLGGGIVASRLILRRIGAITATSDSIMAGDLSRRIPLSGSGDEFDGLAGNLNRMLDRIDELMAGLREVSDNIAHDLKTPLNRLRNRAEGALREARDLAQCREGLERTIEEADEIIKTFNSLLLVARLEAGAVERSLEVFDLAALVRDVVELYEPHAEESRHRLRLQAEEEIEVKANRQLIGQAVANLLDNAIKHSAPAEAGVTPAGDIEVTLARTGENVEISVADHGPGIPAQDRERAVRRFVRLEASRTRPGTGLGLSLVAAVARLHRGTLRLEDNRPGLRAILSWPAPTVLSVS